MPDADARRPRPWRAHWPALVLALAAAAVALWAKATLFPALSWNRDEPVYLWQTELLRDGRLAAPDGGFPALFHPWLGVAQDGMLFTQYTLGWPLVLLAARVLTGTATTALPLSAALAVVGTYALAFELVDRRRVAAVAGALVVASPILAIQGGVHLSYLFTLGLGLGAGTLLLRGLRLERWGPVAGAGALVGWIFLTRPYDALLWAAAFGGYALVVHRARWRWVLGRALVAGLAAAPFVVVALLHNRHLTGSPLTFPMTAKDPLDTFGFGDRRLMPDFPEVRYGPRTALRASLKNAVLLPWFLVGSYLGAVLAALGLWQGRRERPTLALVLVAAVFPAGYVVFWGNHLSSEASRISGPIYLIPLFAPICILMAQVLVRWWEERRALAWAAAGALVVVTVPLAWNRFDVNRRISERQAAWRDSVEAIDDEAVILVADTAYLMYANPWSSNPPDLDGRLLYAAYTHPDVLALVAEHPERVAYVQRASIPTQEMGPREDPRDLTVALDPVEVVAGPGLELAPAIHPPAGAAHVHLWVVTGADSQEWTGSAGGAPPSVRVGPGGLALDDQGFVTVLLGWGASPDEAARPQVRWRFPYRADAERVEVLTPGLAQRHVQLSEDFAEWRHAFELPELEVTVSR